MPNTPIAIVGHVKRARHIEWLAETTQAEFVCMDNGSLGAGRNHERAWEWLADCESEWGLVLEDDAIPVVNFRQQLESALRFAPKPVVSFYLGRGRPPHWWTSIASVIMRPESWITADELLHHVAVAIKTPLIEPMLTHLHTYRDYQRKLIPIDEAIGHWVRYVDSQVAYSNPSIVDHAQFPTLIAEHVSAHISETGVRGEERKAWRLGSRVWDHSVVYMPSPPIYTQA